MSDKTIAEQNPNRPATEESPRVSSAIAASADATVVFGDSGHSVFPALGHKLGEVPRVMLRDEANGTADPVVQAKSSELPATNSDSR